MRLNLDLQPFERKTVAYYCPSPLLVIAMALLSISLYFFLSYTQKTTVEKDVLVAEASLAEATESYTRLLAGKQKLLQERSRYDTTLAEYQDLSAKLSQQRLSWYTLFVQLENCLPGELYFTGVTCDETSNRLFMIRGEAADMDRVISLTNGLLQTSYFSDVQIIKSEKKHLDAFQIDVYEFEINCIFLG
ncbi:MAG: PilN domain-containing protein [Candidatus Wallbacteria bacterium]|nr:PilN domain-containing protein [Candidatus Wallbacteria bacterium]